MSRGNGAGQHAELDPASGLVRAQTQLGDFELTVCTDGTYKLDGGGMFGVVPSHCGRSVRRRAIRTASCRG
jgi:hypothetical protein